MPSVTEKVQLKQELNMINREIQKAETLAAKNELAQVEQNIRLLEVQVSNPCR